MTGRNQIITHFLHDYVDPSATLPQATFCKSKRYKYLGIWQGNWNTGSVRNVQKGILTGAVLIAMGLSPASSGLAFAQAASAGAPTAVNPQVQPRFKSSVDMVSVSAVVRDRKGRFVRDLLQQDFLIAEGGEARRIVDFHKDSDGPVNVALLMDMSGSMRVGTKTADARQAARHIISALRPNDRAALLAFDTRLQSVSPFTSDLEALEAALLRIEPPFGQTSLYDAVADTARIIAGEGEAARARNQPPQRGAVVVITDGIDTRSRLTPDQVAALASEIDIPVYIVAVMAAVDDPRNLSDQPAEGGDLQSLAQSTGGELFTASAPAHASLAARQIVEELRHQYVLAFEASSLPGWRPLEVRARDRNLVVRARTGYTAGETVGRPLEIPSLLDSRNLER